MENAGQKRASASEPGDSFRNTGCYELPFQENLQKWQKKRWGKKYIGNAEKLYYEKEKCRKLYDAQANEIVTQATAQAQEIIDNATMDANEIRIGAIQYTDDLLANAESIIGHTLDSYTTKYDGLINSLQECYDTVRSNRAELDVPEADSSDYNYDSQNGSDQ